MTPISHDSRWLGVELVNVLRQFDPATHELIVVNVGQSPSLGEVIARFLDHLGHRVEYQAVANRTGIVEKEHE